jgi:hypothetical protein
MDASEARPLSEDNVDRLVAFLAPYVDDILARLVAEEFSTPEFIAVLVTDPPAAAAYREALERWGEDEVYSKMVIHGQVIPAILRRSPLVEWNGYAHGEHDPYAVPALWRMVRPAS